MRKPISLHQLLPDWADHYVSHTHLKAMYENNQKMAFQAQANGSNSHFDLNDDNKFQTKMLFS